MDYNASVQTQDIHKLNVELQNESFKRKRELYISLVYDHEVCISFNDLGNFEKSLRIIQGAELSHAQHREITQQIFDLMATDAQIQAMELIVGQQSKKYEPEPLFLP